MKKAIAGLKINPVYERIVPPLSSKERQALKEDIKQNGILEPISVNFDGVILDGHHRFSIAKEIGIKEIEARIPELVDVNEETYAISVNLNRRQLSEDQKMVLANEYREILSKKALQERPQISNRDTSGRIQPTSEDVSEVGNEKTDTRKIAANTFKVSEWKVRQAQELKASAPEKYEEIRSGEKTFVQVKRELNERKPRPVFNEEGKYEVIYADPPWKYEFSSDMSDSIETHYATLSTDEICNLPISTVSNDDAVLFLWATSPKLPEALLVMKSWGFDYRTSMVWIKNFIGPGYYARQRHEILLIGRKGNLRVPAPSNRPDSVVESPKEEHSKKPDVFYELIEKMYPVERKIELFARQTREGWKAWGQEVPIPEMKLE